MLNARTTNIVFTIVLIGIITLDRYVGISNGYYLILFGSYAALQIYGVLNISAGFFVPSKCYGNRQSNQVAITFDDGPLPLLTDRILEILKNNQVPATFFCIGHRAESHPEILVRVDEAGHCIGNHTYSHGKFFDLLTPTQMSKELKKTDDIFNSIISKRPKFFRPPYGVTNPALAKAIKKGNYISMGWNIRSLDTVAKDDDKLFDRVTRNLKGGDVILFHDYCEITIRILPRVLDHITKLGLKVVRLDELMNEKAYVEN